LSEVSLCSLFDQQSENIVVPAMRASTPSVHYFLDYMVVILFCSLTSSVTFCATSSLTDVG